MARIEGEPSPQIIKNVNSIEWGVPSVRSQDQMLQAQEEYAAQQGSKVTIQRQIGISMENIYLAGLNGQTRLDLGLVNGPWFIQPQGLNPTQQ